MRKKKKYQSVYKKNRKSNFLKKIEKGAKKYDEFLESAREKSERLGKELSESGQVIGKEVKKTKEIVGEAGRTTHRFFSRAASGAQASVRFKPIRGELNVDRISPPRPFEPVDIWSGGVTRGLKNGKKIARRRTSGRLPRLF